LIALDDATALYPSLLRRALELVGNQADAEDIVQTAYLRMCEEPPTTQNATEFKHWMRTTVRNLSVDEHRYRKRATGYEVTVTIDGHKYTNPNGRSSYDSHTLVCRDCGDVLARCRCLKP